ncbi:MAG: hypothetical protein V4507_04225 [Verrucomicrobiota bacterium]
MKIWISALILPLTLIASLSAATNENEVKSYLLKTITTMEASSKDLVVQAQRYDALIQKSHGNYEEAWKNDSKAIQVVVEAMREDYKKTDSFGYETIEGIVAGVPSLEQYDTVLDAGVPKAPGVENIAPVTLHLSNGQVIDQEGCLFTYLMEPMLWGANVKWVHPLDLNHDGKITSRESLPKTEAMLAVAQETALQVQNLRKASEAWTPTTDDLFGAMTKMTPTLSEYFEDWKESRYSDQESGKFSAVSRISDMKGIMKSCQIMFEAVKGSVEKKDPSLAKAVHSGFDSIFEFLKNIEKDEAAKKKFSSAQIDELATQAKRHTDQLVPQIEQAWSLTKTTKKKG